MILLNLLSPFKKERLAQLVKFFFVKELLEMLILTATVIAIAYSLSLVVLNEFLIGLAQNTVAINTDHSEFNRDLIKTNFLIKRIRSASADYAPFSPLIVSLAQITPPDIKYNFISFDRAKRQMLISGTASTREVLIKYQETLRAAPWLTNITTPTSELFQKTNINFEIKATVPQLTPITPPKA